MFSAPAQRSASDRYVPATFLTLCLALVLSPAAATAQNTTASEYNLKAVYLYSFGRFTTWPVESGDVLIGVYGDSPIIDPLQHIASTRRIHGREIRVERFDSLADYATCQIVFVAANVAPEDRNALLEGLSGKPILTVGEGGDFAVAGGMVRFFLDAETVRFEININSVKQSGLVLDAKLLRLASRPGK